MKVLIQQFHQTPAEAWTVLCKSSATVGDIVHLYTLRERIPEPYDVTIITRMGKVKEIRYSEEPLMPGDRILISTMRPGKTSESNSQAEACSVNQT